MKYIKQPDKVSCGPIAILNAMKWAGIDATGRECLPYLKFSCRTIDLETPEDFDNHGTYDSDFDRVVRYVGSGVFRVKRKKNPSIKEIRQHLKKGGAVALVYYWENSSEKGEHFCFISGMDHGCFKCVNEHDSDSPTVSLRKPATVKKWLQKYNDRPTAWFLTMEK